MTKGTTDGVNLVMNSWVRPQLQAGQNIVVSDIEHHSNLVPWQMLAESLDLELRLIASNEQGILVDPCSYIDANTGFVAIQQMSNVLGTIHDLAPIIQATHAVGAKVLVDAAQSVPHMKVDFMAMGCDFMVFSAHKMCGPSGVGVLIGKKELLEQMPPYQGGGAMIKEVWDKRFSWGDLPYRFEAGTPNIEGVIGLGAAIEYLEAIGIENIHAHEQALTAHALEQLHHFDEIQIYGPLDLSKRGGLISFNFEGIHPQDIGELLDQQGIAIRTGHHCCQPLMRKYGITGTARASFYLYNTLEEVDVFVKGLKRVQKLMSRVARR